MKIQIKVEVGDDEIETFVEAVEAIRDALDAYAAGVVGGNGRGEIEETDGPAEIPEAGIESLQRADSEDVI